MIGWIYLGVSIAGLLLTLNAYRPLRAELLSVVTFFSGWLTSELPIQTILWQAAATAGLAWAGALGTTPGRAGLGLTLASWVGLANLARQAQQAGAVTDAALDEGLGPGWHSVRDERVSTAGARTTGWAQLLFAFWMRDRRVERVRNIDYWGDGIHRHRLDIYRARETPEQPASVLVYLHGSGWTVGDKREQGLPMMLFLASQGWVCVTANYRLSPRATWPDHLVDAKRAVAWVRQHIGEYGGDASFVAVSGGSAGGQLASLVALTPGDRELQPGFEEADTRVDACVSFYGVYDLTNRDGLRGRGFLWFLERVVMKARFAERPELFRAASPMDRIGPSAPPFMAVHGSNDSLVPVAEARQFVEHLRSASTQPVVYAELPGAQHAFEVFRSLRTAHVVGAVADFLAFVRGRRVTAEEAPRAML
ncbi:MAG: alpha/beta hydrolase fold domain-containing protein [Acidimicrobiales bacterium]